MKMDPLNPTSPLHAAQPISPISKQQTASDRHHQVHSSCHAKGSHFYSKYIQNWLNSTMLLLTNLD